MQLHIKISGRRKRVNDNCTFKSVLKHRPTHSTTNCRMAKKIGQTKKLEQSIPTSLQNPKEFSAPEVGLSVTGKDWHGRNYVCWLFYNSSTTRSGSWLAQRIPSTATCFACTPSNPAYLCPYGNLGSACHKPGQIGV
jgi:hypothetical protein